MCCFNICIFLYCNMHISILQYVFFSFVICMFLFVNVQVFVLYNNILILQNAYFYFVICMFQICIFLLNDMYIYVLAYALFLFQQKASILTAKPPSSFSLNSAASFFGEFHHKLPPSLIFDVLCHKQSPQQPYLSISQSSIKASLYILFESSGENSPGCRCRRFHASTTIVCLPR